MATVEYISDRIGVMYLEPLVEAGRAQEVCRWARPSLAAVEDQWQVMCHFYLDLIPQIYLTPAPSAAPASHRGA